MTRNGKHPKDCPETMKRTLIVGICALVAALVSLQAADVKANWNKHCAKCHGATGKGRAETGKGPRTKDYTNPAVQEKLKDDRMFKETKEGIKEGGRTVMKPYAELLSDPEIKDLVAYIRKFKK